MAAAGKLYGKINWRIKKQDNDFIERSVVQTFKQVRPVEYPDSAQPPLQMLADSAHCQALDTHDRSAQFCSEVDLHSLARPS